MKLSTLSILLGTVISALQVYGLIKPEEFGKKLRQFPRSLAWGYVLMILSTVWFLRNVNAESISDFAAYKKLMLFGFGAVGLLACIFVRDFLAVRGLAILLLLLAKFTLDTARWAETPWRLVLVIMAYVWVIAGIWWTVSPWRLRDILEWKTATPQRIRIGNAVRLCLGLLLIVLGLTVY